MRHFLIGLGLAIALAPVPARAVTILDTNGFEGYAQGDIAGQNGWVNASLPVNDPARTRTPGTIVTGPGGSGQVLQFENIQPTQSAVQVGFANLTGTYRYAFSSFDFLREESGLYNNLDWWPVGANPWYGTAWDNAANAPALVVPFGDTARGTTPQTPGTWEHVYQVWDLQTGRGSAWVNGKLVSDNVDIGKGEFAGWYFDDWQTVEQGRTPGALGRKVYLDNLLVTAGNELPVPEPSSLALLAGGLLPLLGLRRRKSA